MRKIILYTTSTCHRCHAVKQILQANNVEYEEVTDINIMRDRGFIEVPMMDVDEKTLDYGDISAWLKENNYSLFRGGRNEGN